MESVLWCSDDDGQLLYVALFSALTKSVCFTKLFSYFEISTSRGEGGIVNKQSQKIRKKLQESLNICQGKNTVT